MPADEPGSGRLLADDVDDVFAVEVAGFSEESLLSVVVDLFPEELTRSEYSRISVFVDKKRAVIVRARYWDEAGVEIKELRAPANEIREFGGIFVPMQATMRNLLLESQTTLVVTSLEVNPEFNTDTWNLRRLESH